LLRVNRPEPTGWMIVNADAFGRGLGRFIQDEAKLSVLFLDTNARLVAEARAEGLAALCEDALNVDLAEDRNEFQRIGHLLALTDNAQLNELLCHRWGEVLGRDNVFRWTGPRNGSTPVSADGHGRVAFTRVARPSVIATELLNGEARIKCVQADTPESHGVPLLALRAGRIVPTGESEDASAAPAGPDGSERVLLLERPEGFLARSLTLGGVIDLQAGSLGDLYKQLIDFVVLRHPSISKEQLMRDAMEPAELVPAWLGNGVAVPHLYSAYTPQRVCALARLGQGIHLPGHDPLRLVFFLISPAGDPEGHLATLAEIARFCSEPGRRAALQGFAAVTDAQRFIRLHAR
jgi:mannitol/fructose-specific phosphotransferase system IIA component (Ntr-type)